MGKGRLKYSAAIVISVILIIIGLALLANELRLDDHQRAGAGVFVAAIGLALLCNTYFRRSVPLWLVHKGAKTCQKRDATVIAVGVFVAALCLGEGAVVLHDAYSDNDTRFEELNLTAAKWIIIGSIGLIFATYGLMISRSPVLFSSDEESRPQRHQILTGGTLIAAGLVSFALTAVYASTSHSAYVERDALAVLLLIAMLGMLGGLFISIVGLVTIAGTAPFPTYRGRLYPPGKAPP